MRYQRRRQFLQGSLALAGLGLLAGCGPLPREPAPAAKAPRIGFLAATSPSVEAARVEALRQGLRELGYVEGENLVIEWRWAEGRFDRLPDLAAELVRLGVDLIVAGGSTSTRAAKAATTSIPIVMAMDPDPVGNGFVASLARPGGNISGLSTLGQGLSGKRLELLKEAVPGASGVAVLGDASYVGNAEALGETELAAGVLAVRLGYLNLQDHRDLEALFQAATAGGPDAVIVLGGPSYISQRRQLVDLAARSRLPAMYPFPEFVETGGLMSYGVSVTDSYRRAAAYVDKILKGAKPADLPVEQPTRLELVVNLKTAQALGLTIPQSVLLRATEVIQ